ncbi:MAG: HD domain-containing protein [Lachnospiraceae bacterium]|nr:HD domain-containing protein [Lachnospiraceae bacterium]
MMMKNTLFSDKNRNRQNIAAAVICAAGIALNILLGNAVSALGLPLYLDTVGTVAVAVIGGYLPGVTVGFLTNIIKSFSDSSSLYYGVLNVLIAVFATYLADRGWLKKARGIIGTIAVFTFIGGGLGALIPWFIEGLSFDSESLSGILYETGFFNFEISHILSSIIMDLPDKTISVLLVLVILYIVPKKYWQYFSFNGWMQTPLTDEKLVSDRKQVRAISLQTKILLMLGISLTIIAGAALGLGAVVYNKTMMKEHTQSAQGASRIAASIVDGNRIEEYLESGGEGEEYAETKRLLDAVLNSSPDISYIYVYRPEADGCRVIFDVETADTPASATGELIPYDEGVVDYIPSLLAGEEIEPVITNDTFGRLMTVYQPVYDSYGMCTCYAVADIDMEQLVSMELSFYMELSTMFLSFFILICVFAVWLVEYQIIFPINSITRCMDELSDVSQTQEGMDDEVRTIRKLNVHTGDEVEKLYNSLCEMTLNQTEHMRSIRRLSDSTSKMQDGLIITMADLVESRDSDTGAHVQKTAAYVKIIVEGLKKKGYYAEKITPKFMSDVVRSAPLHDVGKINIPDGVLNKPGKLTDEEFEIMKTHTTAGKRIMENAISTVEGDNYLKEARNMAAYHHERWDGKGYPEGLHGEVIPLSARIMAVADVFDALSSPRVYKSAFPLEKSLAIIEEGKGTQFDPKCVEVFVDSIAEVKVILRKYNQEI